MRQTHIVDIQNLCKYYKGYAALQNITLSIGSAEIVGLLGPNGSGKTTLLKILSGLAFSEKGQVKFDTNWRGAVGATLEGQSFLPALSGYRNLELICRYNQIPFQNIAVVNSWLHMDLFLHKKYKTYSTGMKKKLDLAAVFLTEKTFFLLDEPTNGLDMESIIHFKTLVHHLKEKGKSFLVASHISGHLEDMCTRFLFLKNGQLVKDISREELQSGFTNLENAYKEYIGTVSMTNLS